MFNLGLAPLLPVFDHVYNVQALVLSGGAIPLDHACEQPELLTPVVSGYSIPRKSFQNIGSIFPSSNMSIAFLYLSIENRREDSSN